MLIVSTTIGDNYCIQGSRHWGLASAYMCPVRPLYWIYAP